MQLRAVKQGVEWGFGPAEARFVQAILHHILENYRTGPDLDGGGSAALRASGYAPEDEVLWKEERAGFRSAHAGALERWCAALGEAAGEWHLWVLPAAEIETFLLVANDHRMYLARRFQVEEADMTADPMDMPDAGRRMALVEIHVLAQMIEMLLPHAPR